MSSVDTLAPGGIDWETAMTSASGFLQRINNPNKRISGGYEFYAASAQAWVTFAREITMHARAQ